MRAPRYTPGRGRAFASALFLIGLCLLVAALFETMPFGGAPMQTGQEIVARAPGEVGAANIVTSILLAYRGLDTLGEVSVLFAAAAAAGLVLGGAQRGEAQGAPAGFVLRSGAALIFPFLILLGAYIILHGHLTPGGGFQGGAILAAAFFLPLLASPQSAFNHRTATIIEGFAGITFILIGAAALLDGHAFLTPFLGGEGLSELGKLLSLAGKGVVGDLASAGALPLLYLAIGLKVGSELAGLIANIAAVGNVR